MLLKLFALIKNVESDDTTSSTIPPAKIKDATAKNLFFLKGHFDAGTFFARNVSA